MRNPSTATNAEDAEWDAEIRECYNRSPYWKFLPLDYAGPGDSIQALASSGLQTMIETVDYARAFFSPLTSARIINLYDVDSEIETMRIFEGLSWEQIRQRLESIRAANYQELLAAAIAAPEDWATIVLSRA